MQKQPNNIQQTNLSFLTENTIKKAAMQFIKAYYKYRPRKEEEPTLTSLDNRTASGIIADGYYSFKNPDGSKFTSTFEATSYHTKGEVQYRVQKLILFWDSLAISSLFTAFLFSYGHVYNHFTIKQIGVNSTALLFIISLVAINLLYRLLAKGFPRYRYIYAVEQFKRYHANEQWVAIGEDVFENVNDKYFKELKKQCVYNGFGLITVNQKLRPQVLITPSRQEVFKGRRKAKEFVEQKNWMGKVKQVNSTGFSKIKESLPTFTRMSSSLIRYQKSFYQQLFLSLVSFALVGTILYRELLDADIIYVDKTVYNDEEVQIDNIPETRSYIVDSTTQAPLKVPNKNETWWDNNNSTSVAESSKKQEVKTPKPTTEPEPEPEPEFESEVLKTELLAEKGAVEVSNEIPDECFRFFTFQGKKYIVEEGAYSKIEFANQKIELLEEFDLEGGVLPLTCFSKNETGYSVYFNFIYNTEEEANEFFSEIIGKDLDIKFKDLRIRMIEPVISEE